VTDTPKCRYRRLTFVGRHRTSVELNETGRVRNDKRAVKRVKTQRIVVEMEALEERTRGETLQVFCSRQTVEGKIEVEQCRAARKWR
jgi:hypothetical protein